MTEAEKYLAWCEEKLEKAKRDYSEDVEYILSCEEDVDNARFYLAEENGIEIYR